MRWNPPEPKGKYALKVRRHGTPWQTWEIERLRNIRSYQYYRLVQVAVETERLVCDVVKMWQRVNSLEVSP